MNFFYISTSLLCSDDEYLHTLVVLNNFSCLVVFGQPFMTISVMFKQLFTFSLCSNSLLFLAVFKLLFLLSHV